MAFVCQVIERLDPWRLQLSVSWRAIGNSLYEWQHQNEFYRPACYVIPKIAILLADAGHMYGANGYSDYLLSSYGWDLELLRDGAKLK